MRSLRCRHINECNILSSEGSSDILVRTTLSRFILWGALSLHCRVQLECIDPSTRSDQKHKIDGSISVSATIESTGSGSAPGVRRYDGPESRHDHSYNNLGSLGYDSIPTTTCWTCCWVASVLFTDLVHLAHGILQNSSTLDKYWYCSLADSKEWTIASIPALAESRLHLGLNRGKRRAQLRWGKREDWTW